MIKNIVSFSGGKDSTAMLLMMLKKNMPIDEIVFCDTGMEFPQMYEHIHAVEYCINRPITVLKAKHSFEHYLGTHIKRNGGIGYGFPDFRNRWCTTLLKQNIMRKHCKGHKEYHGIAVDEIHRVYKNNDNRIIEYPLVDWFITEKQALEYCYKEGFKWGGLYEKFDRVSCWCCPLQPLGSLRVLRKNFPTLWDRLLTMQDKSWNSFQASGKTVFDLDKRFAEEDRQLQLFKGGLR